MKVVQTALLVSLVVLLALAAWLDWPRSEPAARRRLALRAAELEAWLRQELQAPIDRVAFAEAGGAPEAAEAWREVLRELEGVSARAATKATPLPSLAGPDGPGVALRVAVGARRFTPFPTIEALLSSDWLRGARLFASLIDRAPASADGAPDSSILPWLDAAIVLSSDLRSTGLLAPALGAAELEESIERRLARDASAVGDDALRSLVAHADAAASSLPALDRVAERESRLAQAWACAHARVPPFGEASRAIFDECDAPWPLVAAAAAVERLEEYDARLRQVLMAPGERARSSYDAWSGAFARELPAAAALVADPALLPPLRDAALRLARIREAAARRLGTSGDSR